MAKHLIQLVIAGAQIVTKAFTNAVRQEIRMSQEAAKRNSSARSTKNFIILPLKYICQIHFLIKYR